MTSSKEEAKPPLPESGEDSGREGRERLRIQVRNQRSQI